MEKSARDLEQDLALCEKATKGPWVACETDDGHEIVMGDFLLEAEELGKLGRASHHEIQYEHMCFYDDELDENNPGNIQAAEAEANAEFIAAAREALPYWLGEVRRLREDFINEGVDKP